MLWFFFNDTATTEIYTLSLRDALPICRAAPSLGGGAGRELLQRPVGRHCGHEVGGGVADREQLSVLVVAPHLAVQPARLQDRKSTRLNSSHANISYAVLCLKQKIFLET